jgi:hypothetical protein
MLPSLFGESGDVDIDAVLVEESAHHHAAELPFVRELCLLTTMEREFSPSDLKRVIEVRKQRLMKLMEVTFRGHGVDYSIRTVQAAANLLQELASVSDITMFVPLRRLRRQFVNLPEPSVARRGRVVVVLGDLSGAREALLTGLRLAGGNPQRVAVLVTGEAAATVEADIATRIGGLLSAVPAGIRVVPGHSVKILIRETALEKPETLVLGATAQWLESGAIETLQEQLSCPICLVRKNA